MIRLFGSAALVAALLSSGLAGAQAPAPVPRPFPGAGSSTAPARPAPAPAPAQPGEPRVAEPAPEAAPAQVPTPPAPLQIGPDIGNIPIYPTASYLESLDAGRGQRYYLYGTNTGYEIVMGYYRNALRNGGREIYEEPAIRQWDLGRYDDERMAFPPSVVVKDYTWGGSEGYLHVSGTTATRYRTIIQIVPPAPEAR